MKEKIVEKIQKMLRLAANDPDSEESKTAARMAGELMSKYDIESFELQEKPEIEITEALFDRTITSDDLWQGSLAVTLANVFDCVVIRETFGKESAQWRFMGHKSDIVLVSWYFKFLRIKIGKMGSDLYKKKREKRDYCLGLVLGLKKILEVTFKARSEGHDPKTKELVVLKRKFVEDFVEKKYSNLKKTKSSAKLNQDAMNKGFNDSGKISLHRPVQGNSHSKSLAKN